MSETTVPKISVLLVDADLHGLRELQRYTMHNPRLELAQPCKTGRGALNFLKHEQVDLVIMNPALPDANGFELMASLPDPPTTIIVADRKDYAYFAFRIHAIDYLLKPISVTDLDNAIARVVQQADLKNELARLKQRMGDEEA